MASTSKESDADLLAHVEVVVACSVCDSSYSVPASVVRESQRLLAEDYCGESLFECDALYYATLIEAEAIADLERAWARFQESATSHGGMRIVVVGGENESGPCEHLRAALAERRARAGTDKIVSEPPTDPGSARSS
jgi:hypothetical protein